MLAAATFTRTSPGPAFGSGSSRSCWAGVKKLRRVMAVLAEMLAPQRHACCVECLLELLERARDSKGPQQPVQ